MCCTTGHGMTGDSPRLAMWLCDILSSRHPVIQRLCVDVQTQVMCRHLGLHLWGCSS